MASKAHDIIAALIARSMRNCGYEPISADVREILFGDMPLPTSQVIGLHRPDLIGYRKSDQRICIGEAKTTSDIRSRRTKEEIRDFAACDGVELFIGIPADGVKLLNGILEELGLEEDDKIRRIVVPQELLS